MTKEERIYRLAEAIANNPCHWIAPASRSIESFCSEIANMAFLLDRELQSRLIEDDKSNVEKSADELVQIVRKYYGGHGIVNPEMEGDE